MAEALNNSLSTVRPFVLPTLATLLGLTGLAGGVYSFVSPLDVIKPFGLSAPSKPTTPHTDAFHTALIRVYGIRNFGGALSNLALTGFWLYTGDEVVKKCLGLSLCMGVTVALGDAWIVADFEGAIGLSGEEKEAAGKASRGHAIAGGLVALVGAGLLLG